MNAKFEPRFPECRECKFYRPSQGAARCLSCGAGEFFEPKDAEEEPTDNELIDLFRQMDRNNDDN